MGIRWDGPTAPRGAHAVDPGLVREIEEALAAVADAAQWVACTDVCDSPATHAFFAAPRCFVWRVPRVRVFRPAVTLRGAGLNRYPHQVIGGWLVVFGRCWAVTWKGTPRRAGDRS